MTRVLVLASHQSLGVSPLVGNWLFLTDATGEKNHLRPIFLVNKINKRQYLSIMLGTLDGKSFSVKHFNVYLFIKTIS